MAQRLQAEGHQVPYLAVLDHVGPDAKVGWTDWIRWHLICLSQLEAGDKVRYVRDGLGNKIRSNTKLPLILRRIAAGSLGRNDGSGKATTRLRQVQASLTAMADYRIKPYAVPQTVTECFAEAGSGDDFSCYAIHLLTGPTGPNGINRREVAPFSTTPYIFRNLGEILPVTMIRVKSLM